MRLPIAVFCALFLLYSAAFADPIIDPLEDGANAARGGDYQAALKLWLPLAEHGNAKAQYDVGVLYKHGDGDIPQDYAAAAKWFRKSADQGNTAAMFLLGALYEDGKGVPQDWDEALNWFRKAAYHGDTFAQSRLGRLYSLGKGVKQDWAQAYFWQRLAAEKAANHLTQEQKASVEKRLQDWRQAYSDNPPPVPAAGEKK